MISCIALSLIFLIILGWLFSVNFWLGVVALLILIALISEDTLI